MKICPDHESILRRELWVAGLPPKEVGNFEADNPLVKAKNQIIHNALTIWPSLVEAPNDLCPLCYKRIETLSWPNEAARQLKESR